MAKARRKKKSTKSSSSGKKRRGLNLDKARDKQKEMENRSGSDLHDLRQGMNYFFIMPPWSDDVDVLWHEVQQHGMNVCPRTAAGKRCILCDEIRKRAKKGDQDFCDKHRLRSRAFLNAIRKEDIKDREPSNVKVLALSPTVFQELLDYISDEEKDVSDPYAAVPICIRRKGEGLKTRYKVRFGEETDISRFLTEDVLEALWDLSAVRYAQPAGVKELRKAIRGAADDDFDDEDDDGFDEDDLDDEGDEGDGEDEEDTVFDDDDDEFVGDDDDDPDEDDPDDDDPDEDDPDDDDPDDDDEDDELDGLLDEDDEDDEPEPPKKKPRRTAAKKRRAKR